MYNRVCSTFAVAGLALVLCSCNSDDSRIPDEELYLVEGQVFYTTGEPASGVQATFHPKAEVDAGKSPRDYKTYTGIVDADGNLETSTHQQGDGIPPGDYVVTFILSPPRIGVSVGGRGGPQKMDKLGGKYSDPKMAEHTVSVSEGGENDVGRVEVELAEEPTPIES